MDQEELERRHRLRPGQRQGPLSMFRKAHDEDIIWLLRNDGPMFMWDMKHRLRCAVGSLITRLAILEHSGKVVSYWDDDAGDFPRRRVYAIGVLPWDC